jgi:hypothetical protein
MKKFFKTSSIAFLLQIAMEREPRTNATLVARVLFNSEELD